MITLIHPSYATAFLRTLAGAKAGSTQQDDSGFSPFAYRIENGAAIIPLQGVLISDFAVGWGFTSYEILRAQLMRAANDPKVARVVLAINSPGGEVAGLDGAAATIENLIGQKPVTAHVQGVAASAAYWLASQCHEIVVSQLSEVGSIGCVFIHVDHSQFFESAGFKVSLIASGRHKLDANAYEALSSGARADIQARVDSLRDDFAREVGAGRGERFSYADALATEAKIFSAPEAVKSGLADRLGTLDDVLGEEGKAGARLAMAHRRAAKSGNPKMAAAGLEPWSNVIARMNGQAAPRPPQQEAAGRHDNNGKPWGQVISGLRERKISENP